MRARRLTAAALLATSLGTGLVLVRHEADLEPPPAAPPSWVLPPATEGQTYGPELRRSNLQRVGLTGERLVAAEAAAAAVVARRDVLGPALRRLDATRVAGALCVDAVPALYRALPVLAEGRGGVLRVRDLAAEGPVPDGDPARSARRVRRLYDAAERASGPRRTDAHALLALAALAGGHVDEALAEPAPEPWRAPAGGDDPLRDVAELWPGLVAALPAALGTAHGLAEIVNADPAAYGCPGVSR